LYIRINTPGVIGRVKNLFCGYNDLILGFNRFLPEGEGQKIEITAEDEEAEAAQEAEAAHERQQSMLMHNTQPMTIVNMMGSGRAATPNQAEIIPDPNATAGGFKPQQMQQQHAISYVTQIRNRFASEPETYRAFLKILHTYQKEQKGIKDVLEQVSQLLAGHPDLLMEFTYFLPDAVQEQAKERLRRAEKESEMRKKHQPQQVQTVFTAHQATSESSVSDQENVSEANKLADSFDQLQLQPPVSILQPVALPQPETVVSAEEMC
jgi:histone deacetylase complex regulatory component SIN3